MEKDTTYLTSPQLLEMEMAMECLETTVGGLFYCSYSQDGVEDLALLAEMEADMIFHAQLKLM
jgi:hypothetical protein